MSDERKSVAPDTNAQLADATTLAVQEATAAQIEACAKRVADALMANANDDSPMYSPTSPPYSPQPERRLPYGAYPDCHCWYCDPQPPYLSFSPEAIIRRRGFLGPHAPGRPDLCIRASYGELMGERDAARVSLTNLKLERDLAQARAKGDFKQVLELEASFAAPLEDPTIPDRPDYWHDGYTEMEKELQVARQACKVLMQERDAWLEKAKQEEKKHFRQIKKQKVEK